jgi:hypothetical protein
VFKSQPPVFANVPHRPCSDLHTIRPSSASLRVEIGRAMFQALPSKYLGFISRVHCTIEPLKTGSFASPTSSLSVSTTPAFQIVDSSGNGTYLNGRLLSKNQPVPLNDGDKITILSHRKAAATVEPTILGYEPRHTFANCASSNRRSTGLHSKNFAPPVCLPLGATFLLVPQSVPVRW